MAGNLTLEDGHFQDFEGNPVANGYLIMELSHDEQYITSNYQVVAGLKIKVPLDASGDINPTVDVYSNDVLSPSGSFYIVRCFSAEGQEVWAAPQYWNLSSSPNPLDVGTISPTNPPTSGLSGSGSSLILETNGTRNGSQTLLNLQQSTGITITDNGTGTVSIASSGSSSLINFRKWECPANVTSSSLVAGFGCLPTTSMVSSINNVAATTTEPPMADFRAGGGASEAVLWDGTSGPIYPVTFGLIQKLKMRIQLPVTEATGTWRNFEGWSDTIVGSTDDPTTTNTVAFRYILGTDTNWSAYVSGGSGSTIVDTGIAIDTDPHTFQIDSTSSSHVFSIDGTTVATITTNIPATSVGCWPITQSFWSGGVYNMYIGAVYWELNSSF